MYLIIRNPRTGLSKTVDATDYTELDYMKTVSVYALAGYNVSIS